MILTKKDFCLYVEEKYLESGVEETMIDVVLEACEKYNIDPELIEPLINRSVKEKLEQDFINLHLLKSQHFSVI